MYIFALTCKQFQYYFYKTRLENLIYHNPIYSLENNKSCLTNEIVNTYLHFIFRYYIKDSNPNAH